MTSASELARKDNEAAGSQTTEEARAAAEKMAIRFGEHCAEAAHLGDLPFWEAHQIMTAAFDVRAKQLQSDAG